MSRRKYGILLVTGAETHQENYGDAFAQDERCNLIALTDEKAVTSRRLALNQRLAREFGIPYIDDLSTALRRPDVDIVCICAEPERRARIAVQSARARKHLYMDKSLCTSLADADQIAKAVHEAGVRSHMFCFVAQPWALRAQSVLKDPRFGDLIAIHADTHFSKGHPGTAKLGVRSEQFPPPASTFQTIRAKREMDNVGVYPITLIHWLTAAKSKKVYCRTANYFFRGHQEVNAEDFGLLSIILDNDIPVTIAASRCGWNSHPAGGVNRLVLVGSKTTVVVEPHRPRFEYYNDQKPWVAPAVNPKDPMGFWSSTQAEVHTMPKTTWDNFETFTNDASYFVDCIEQGRESEVSVNEAALATEVLMAGYKSAASGTVTMVPMERE